MKIHCLQHVEFEGPAYIKEWAAQNSCDLKITKLYKNEKLPSIDTYDLLVIMGGSMSTSDTDKYEWMIKEKRYLKEAVSQDKHMLGICLGSQLLAEALGAAVYDNPEQEIGWFEIDKKDQSIDYFDNKFMAFHWHGQTYDIPEDAKCLGSSEACQNQGFILNNRFFAFQFHLEATSDSIELMLKNCARDVTNDRFVQSEKEIKDNFKYINQINNNMLKVLNYLKNKMLTEMDK